uniref:N(6)-L-threonylcarbamoyladenine synthase n=1 Tax=Lygus hesperus TaxID=30085 RepID=A0A0A9Z2B8_LYGHE
MITSRCALRLRGLLQPFSCPCHGLSKIESRSSANPQATKTPATFRSASTESKAKIFGIETSCDDTGVAILDTAGHILGESLFSQQELHSDFGGIIPPLARDLHLENIQRASDIALEKANMTLQDVDAIAVTNRPGLPLSLLVGLNHAKRLAASAKKPLIPIHHMEAHALTVRMVEKVEFPFLVLLISGGHSLVAVAQDVSKFLLLGSTFDDAPGEAFDKVARRLKLRNLEEFTSMSGGQAIETAASRGDPTAFPIAEPLLHNKDCNFSFAGIKNSARSFIIQEEEKHGIEGDEVLPNVNDLCASVQLAITKHLCRRVGRAMEFVDRNNLLPNDRKSLVVSGGVACNGYIGRAMHYVGSRCGYNVFIPPRNLCTDNGVMIAWNGVEKWKAGLDIHPHDSLGSIDIESKCPLGKDIRAEVVSSCVRAPPLPVKELVDACNLKNSS